MSVAPPSQSAAILPQSDFRRRFPPLSIGLIVLALLAVVAFVQLRGERIEEVVPLFDGAVVNIASLIFSFLAFMTAYIWFVWWSVYSVQTRRIVFALPIVAIVVAIATLRYEGVDGYMKPTFVPRWQQRHEDSFASVPAANESRPAIANNQPSETPAAIPAAKTVDLRTERETDFVQFLGPNRNNSLAGPELSADWKTMPPKELWRRDVGPGWSGFAARNGFAVTLEQRGNEEWATCYDIATGELVWHHAAPGKHHEPLGGTGPRSTPTIDDGLIYVQGAAGLVRCLDGANGQRIWEDDLLKRYDLTQVDSEAAVKWGRSGSPLVVGDLVIVPAGGKGDNVRSLIAYHKKDGQVAWEAGKDQLSYASPVYGTIGGVQQVLYVSEKKLTGFDLEGGKELWQHEWPGNSGADANVSQAIPLGDDRVFASKGYGTGSALLKIVKDGTAFTAEPIWESRRVLKTKFTNATIIEGYAYGLSDGVLECVEVETGKQKWRGGRYGHGQVLGVGDKLLVLGEGGDLMLVAATPEKFQQLGKIDALSDKAWNNLCLTGNRLLIRNGKEAVCYELP